MKDYSAVVLAGGLGTRLRPVIADVPKPMAPVRGKPFLTYVAKWIGSTPPREIIMALCYEADQIKDYFGSDFNGVPIRFSVESAPRGTAGGVAEALHILGDEDRLCLVCNGDTYHPVNIADMIEFHIQSRASLTIAGAKVTDVARYGSVSIDRDSRVIALGEKSGHGEGVINAGIYIASKKYFLELASLSSSLETAITSAVAKTGVFLYRDGSNPPAAFLDIGIPDDYAKASRVVD